MWQQTRINAFNINSESWPVPRFDLICMMAKCMKGCHYFMIDPITKTLYGCPQEGYVLHAMPLPSEYRYAHPISFRLDIIQTLYLDTVMRHKNFLFNRAIPYVLFPTQLANADYLTKYMGPEAGWQVIARNGQPIECVNLYGPDITAGPHAGKYINISLISNMVSNMLASREFLGPSKFIDGIHLNPAIQEVFSAKAVAGSKFIPFQTLDGATYGITVYKSLFTMNKSDVISLEIRDSTVIPMLFQATFTTYKKRSPIPEVTHNYMEQVCFMALNV